MQLFKSFPVNLLIETNRFVFPLLFALFFICELAPAQWITQNSGTTEHLYDVFFINTQTGWACGNSGTMIKTTNGGDNWFSLNSGITDRPLNSVFFINQNTGWSCTSLFSIAGLIIKTTNGGTNWFVQYSTTTKSFFVVYFIDSLKGWVTSSGSGGWIFRTTNGGNTWDSTSTITGIGRDIKFINAQTGWLALSSQLYKSTNGGVNWFEQYFTGGGEISSLSFVNLNTGYFITLATYRIYKTIDSGNNWTFLTALPTCAYSHCIFFTNVNSGWVSGDCGWLFSSTNGGLNWYQQATNTSNFLQSVVFVTDSIGWAVGGVGKIIHTVSGGQIMSVVKSYDGVPEEFRLYQNYPNPFNSETLIKFEITESDFYKMELYDVTGKKIETLMEKFLNQGTYVLNYEAKNLSSGVYLYNLLSKNEFRVRKFVLIK